MNFYAFRAFSPVMQRYWVLRHGTFLASRWEQESGVNFYYCADEGRGFFMEVVGVDDGQGQAVVLRSFVNCGPLADYTHGMRLPED